MSTTEDRNPNSYDLDLKSTDEILRIINQEDQQIALRVKDAMDQISPLVDEVIRVFYKVVGFLPRSWDQWQAWSFRRIRNSPNIFCRSKDGNRPYSRR